MHARVYMPACVLALHASVCACTVHIRVHILLYARVRSGVYEYVRAASYHCAWMRARVRAHERLLVRASTRGHVCVSFVCAQALVCLEQARKIAVAQELVRLCPRMLSPPNLLLPDG